LFFSPDFSKFAYNQPLGAEQGSPVELHVANLDGSDDHIYYTGKAGFENWSPDSQNIIFWAERRDNTQIVKIGENIVRKVNIGNTHKVDSVGWHWIDTKNYLAILQAADSSESDEVWIGTIGEMGIRIIEFTGSRNLYGYGFDFAK
jgi:hypothetical protein